MNKQNQFYIIDPWLVRPRVLSLEVLPESMRLLAKEIGREPSQEAALRYAYDALGKKYRGYRILTFLRLDCLFIHNLSTLWERSGFLHCHHLNYLLRTLLVASGKFQNDAIVAHWTQIWLFSPHQYLTVEFADGRKVEVDLWGLVYGIPYGSHAHGFAGGTTFANIDTC